MPERLNAVHQQPSPQIVFIKPLPGPDSQYAQDFLERIAAICHPIMKGNHLRIMTLEEHEPNREFIGRNFNAGEIIQLVLKARNTGHWLSFRTVQMVMMHELAHCQRMNHGRDFWKVNAKFKEELKALWSKGYTGEGLWGRGRTLLSGDYDRGSGAADEILPPQLCGGAFRSRRRRRRRRADGVGTAPEHPETYAEKKKRRIEKKFGVNGTTLGGNEETRVKLENGQQVKGNPRVASSGRGRELRVAAALARFGQQKEEDAKKEEAKTKTARNSDSSTGESNNSDDEYEEVEDGAQAFDLDGSEIRDAQGHRMIKVCEDEDADDEHVKQEMEELRGLGGFAENGTSDVQTRGNNAPTIGFSNDLGSNPSLQTEVRGVSSSPQAIGTSVFESGISGYQAPEKQEDKNCPICSMSNDAHASLCAACNHVLDISKIRDTWRCQSDVCRSSTYINASDLGLCGVCGSQKPSGTGLI